MASPILSRTPSTAAFAPGPHRRSHPNLQNLSTLSLAPLTPKYPIDPADYDAYFDPSTSELHTSASLSQIATVPSPGGILTHSPVRSRDPSRTRKQRRIKSHVHICEPEQEQLQKSLSENNNNSNTEPIIADRKPKPSKSQLRLSKIRTTDPSWLVQTGLSLTESSRETKGQSWLSKRDSSTSLAATPSDYFTINDRQREGQTPRSGRNTPARSRVPSRNASRSRLAGLTLTDLRMTTSEATSPTAERERGGSGIKSKTASFVTAAELELDDQIQEDDEEEEINVQPNWADAKTQAELAAQLQEELGDDYYEDGGDPYGMLNFEEQRSDNGDSDEDEEEVRRAMSRYRLGGWMGLDGAIDALLRVEEVNDGSQIDVEQGVEELSKRDSAEDVETPPQTSSAGSWVDVSWFGRLFGRSVGT